MTNAITNHGTALTRTFGIGSALRCVAAVGRDARACHAPKRSRLLDQPGTAPRCDSVKRLHEAHPLAAAYAGMRPTSDASLAARPRSAAIDLDLPPAVWASLVVVRAVSA